MIWSKITKKHNYYTNIPSAKVIQNISILDTPAKCTPLSLSPKFWFYLNADIWTWTWFRRWSGRVCTEDSADLPVWGHSFLVSNAVTWPDKRIWKPDLSGMNRPGFENRISPLIREWRVQFSDHDLNTWPFCLVFGLFSSIILLRWCESWTSLAFKR